MAEIELFDNFVIRKPPNGEGFGVYLFDEKKFYEVDGTAVELKEGDTLISYDYGKTSDFGRFTVLGLENNKVELGINAKYLEDMSVASRGVVGELPMRILKHPKRTNGLITIDSGQSLSVIGDDGKKLSGVAAFSIVEIDKEDAGVLQERLYEYRKKIWPPNNQETTEAKVSDEVHQEAHQAALNKISGNSPAYMEMMKKKLVAAEGLKLADVGVTTSTGLQLYDHICNAHLARDNHISLNEISQLSKITRDGNAWGKDEQRRDIQAINREARAKMKALLDMNGDNEVTKDEIRDAQNALANKGITMVIEDIGALADALTDGLPKRFKQKNANLAL